MTTGRIATSFHLWCGAIAFNTLIIVAAHICTMWLVVVMVFVLHIVLRLRSLRTHALHVLYEIHNCPYASIGIGIHSTTYSLHTHTHWCTVLTMRCGRSVFVVGTPFTCTSEMIFLSVLFFSVTALLYLEWFLVLVQIDDCNNDTHSHSHTH